MYSMSRRSLGINFKLSRLENFLMPGASGKGRGGSTTPPQEEPPLVASGKNINTIGKDLERGGRRRSPDS